MDLIHQQTSKVKLGLWIWGLFLSFIWILPLSFSASQNRNNYRIINGQSDNQTVCDCDIEDSRHTLMNMNEISKIYLFVQ